MSAEVSIIVPIYGVEGYIGRCAGSLFAQTVPELRFIFVDDCSPDRSVEELEETLREHPHRKEQTTIIRLKENGGVSHARRVGFEASDSRYVLFVDSDDFVEPEMVEALLSRARETDADMTVCRFNLVSEADGSRMLSPLRDEVSDHGRYLGHMIAMNGAKASPNIFNKLFKTELLKSIETVPAADIAEDWMICVQAVHKAGKIASLDEPLYNYTVREGSATREISIEASRRSARADMANIDLIIGYLKSKGLAERYRHEIEARKFVAKGSFYHFCDDPAYHQEWKDIYREINGRILFNPCLSFHNRKTFVLCWFRLTSKYYSLTGAVRRLLGKSLKP